MYTLNSEYRFRYGELFRTLARAKAIAKFHAGASGEEVKVYRIANYGGLTYRGSAIPVPCHAAVWRPYRPLVCRDCGRKDPRFLSRCPGTGDVHNRAVENRAELERNPEYCFRCYGKLNLGPGVSGCKCNRTELGQ